MVTLVWGGGGFWGPPPLVFNSSKDALDLCMTTVPGRVGSVGRRCTQGTAERAWCGYQCVATALACAFAKPSHAPRKLCRFHHAQVKTCRASTSSNGRNRRPPCTRRRPSEDLARTLRMHSLYSISKTTITLHNPNPLSPLVPVRTVHSIAHNTPRILYPLLNRKRYSDSTVETVVRYLL